MLTSLRTTWRHLPLPQRIALVAVLAAVFAGILLIAASLGRPSYRVLYSNLSPEDAGEVQGKLRELKVEYRLSGGGQTIEVPTEKVEELHNALAADGLPRGGNPGFELFDKTTFGATDFTQHLNYQRALEGELTRTIKTLEGVTQARVHLAMPEKALFTREQDPVTASVVLHLRPGHRLSERQINGIVHLVSLAIPSLQPDNVSVLDERMNMLSANGDNSPLSGSQFAYQERLEQRTAAELQRLADQVLGVGKCTLRVSAELDWDQTETTSETFKPGGADGKNLPTEERTTREALIRSASSAVPPAVLGSAPAPAQGTRPAGYDNTREDRRYAVNKTTERRVTAPGKIRRLSVAVFLDATIDAARLQQLKNAFATGAGLDLMPLAAGGRGDRIELVQMPFDKSVQQSAAQESQAAARQQMQSALIRNGAALLIVALIGAATVGMLRRPRRAAPERPQIDVVVGEETAALDGVSLPALESGRAAPQSGNGAGEELLPDPLDTLRETAAQRPEEIAQLLRSWLQPLPLPSVEP